jgi:hypothetical protein
VTKQEKEKDSFIQSGLYPIPETNVEIKNQIKMKYLFAILTVFPILTSTTQSTHSLLALLDLFQFEINNSVLVDQLSPSKFFYIAFEDNFSLLFLDKFFNLLLSVGFIFLNFSVFNFFPNFYYYFLIIMLHGLIFVELDASWFV